MQQATVNLFADMGVQPATLQPGLMPAIASSRTSIAADVDDHVAGGRRDVSRRARRHDHRHGDRHRRRRRGGVEVSTDGGTTWQPANGRQTWTYTWLASGSGGIGAQEPRGRRQRQPRDGATARSPSVHRHAARAALWNPAITTPATVDAGDASRGRTRREVPRRHRRLHHRHPLLQGRDEHRRRTSATCGRNTGTLLATATFTGETASGWQQVNFATPVAITANTTYVASYHTNVGHYCVNDGTSRPAGVDNAPLHALAERRRRRQRRLSVPRRERVPERRRSTRQLLGRRASLAAANTSADLTAPQVARRRRSMAPAASPRRRR